MDLRRATDEEIAAIKECAAHRKKMDIEERKAYKYPDAAKQSAEGGLYWAAVEIWQDKPIFIIAGAAAILWNVVMAVIHIGQSIALLI